MSTVRQLVTHQTRHQGSKPDVVLFNGGSYCRPLSAYRRHVYSFRQIPVLDLERRQYQEKLLSSSTLPVIIRHLGYTADDDVARCRPRSCTRDWLCNPISTLE